MSEVTILAPSQHLLLLKQAKEFAQIASGLATRADETSMIDGSVWSALHDSGLSMAAFDPAFGGSGLGNEHQNTLCSILRMIGGADLSVARIFEGHVNAVMLVSRYGTTAQIESLADSVRDGELSGVWGAEDGKGLRRIRRGHLWSLEGTKIMASGALSISRPLITLGTPDGHVLYVLDFDPCERADTTSWKPIGMTATASGTVNLTGISVGHSEQIGTVGDYMRQPFFSAGAWRFCAAQLGAMERLTGLYGALLRSRGRDGDPYQLQRVAHCTAACGTALFWVEEASRRFGDESLEPAAVVAFTNLTRMVTERAALDVMELVQRGAGLPAFMHASPIGRISRDLGTYLRQPVPDMAMSDAARAVLTGELTIGAFP
jgi:alkylation response protein AidB-like acyl-CoA dehydrogenase